MHVLRAWRAGLVAGVMLTAGWALADDPAAPSVEYPVCTRTPTEADLEGAKGAHRAAIQFYERADYERAVQYWRDAYEFDCTAHGVLINIASAYEKKGDRVRAVETLEAYLSRAPDAPDAVTIQERVQNLKAALKAEQDRKVVPTATAKPPPPPPKLPPPPPPVMVRPYGYAPLVVAGAGGVAMLVGAILTPTGLSAISDAEDRCPGRVGCSQDIADQGNSGRSQATVGGVALGLGAAALGGGLVWHFGFNNPVPQAAPAKHPGPKQPATQPGSEQPETQPGSEQPETQPLIPPETQPLTPPAQPGTPPAEQPVTPPAGSAPQGAYLRLAPSVGTGYGGLSISGRF